MKAVLLAAGRGTRLRAADSAADLTPEQARVAATGVKALMPIHGRPFIDHQVEALARAGIADVGVVIGRRQAELRRHLSANGLAIAVQDRRRGTAHALLAAEELAGGSPFLMVNGDTWYPPAALRALVALDGPGLVAFDPVRLADSRASNVTAERIASFALVEATLEGTLARLTEKPGAESFARLRAGTAVSLNCWRFARSIFDACRAIGPSPRGELEITAAVQWAVDERGEAFRVVRSTAPVLDLSRRRDVAEIERRLLPLAAGARGC